MNRTHRAGVLNNRGVVYLITDRSPRSTKYCIYFENKQVKCESGGLRTTNRLAGCAQRVGRNSVTESDQAREQIVYALSERTITVAVAR